MAKVVVDGYGMAFRQEKSREATPDIARSASHQNLHCFTLLRFYLDTTKVPVSITYAYGNILAVSDWRSTGTGTSVPPPKNKVPATTFFLAACVFFQKDKRNFRDVSLWLVAFVVTVVGSDKPGSIDTTALFGADLPAPVLAVVITGFTIPPPSTRPFKDFLWLR